MVDFVVLAGVVFAFGLVSRRLEGTILTAPIVFVAAGMVLGPAGVRRGRVRARHAGDKREGAKGARFARAKRD
jgi:xanthine/uracil/vitamin C permease (AzgA family)